MHRSSTRYFYVMWNGELEKIFLKNRPTNKIFDGSKFAELKNNCRLKNSKIEKNAKIENWITSGKNTW